MEDWNRSNPDQPRRKSYVEETLKGHQGPVVISTDYVQAYGEQLRRLIPNPLTVLGTDGFGRSDSREVLRKFFKVDRYHIVVAALRGLMDQGQLESAEVTRAMKQYQLDVNQPHALTR